MSESNDQLNNDDYPVMRPPIDHRRYEPPRLDHPKGPARCITCGYVLEGLPSRICPECGRVFDLDNFHSYSRRRPLIRWRLWMPSVLLALALGLVMFIVFTAIGGFGYGVTLGLPVAIGSVLGYRLRMHWSLLAVVGLTTCTMLVVGLMSFSLAGAYCGLILGIIAAVPILLGTFLGWGLREILKACDFSQSDWLPLLVLCLGLIGLALFDRYSLPKTIPTSSTTTRTIDAQPSDVWDALHFYEDVRHEPPLLLRLGLPKPLTTSGSMKKTGDIQSCIYDKGRLVKQITDVDDQKRIGFAVIDQHIGFERSIALRGGSFELTDLQDGRTELVLTTQYDAKLHPRFAWQWAERLAVQTLHEYVIEGIAQQCETSMQSVALERDGR